jgi:hypothetical protein
MGEILEEIFLFRMRFSGFSKDNVLRAARTLSEKPVILDGRKLQFPMNRVFHAEYDKKSDEIHVVLITIEQEILESYRENRQLFASISFLERYLPRLFFTNLILSTKPFESGYKISLNRVPDLRTAIKQIFSENL